MEKKGEQVTIVVFFFTVPIPSACSWNSEASCMCYSSGTCPWWTYHSKHRRQPGRPTPSSKNPGSTGSRPCCRTSSGSTLERKHSTPRRPRCTQRHSGPTGRHSRLSGSFACSGLRSCAALCSSSTRVCPRRCSHWHWSRLWRRSRSTKAHQNQKWLCTPN